MYTRYIRAKAYTLIIIVLIPLKNYCQYADTLQISLKDAEKIFIDSNLTLLAAHYNIASDSVLINQAKKWDNPVLVTDQVVHANGTFFPYHPGSDGNYNGQFFIQVQQLIRTAGKRSLLSEIAASNTEIAKLQFDDLMRGLKYQLRTDYYTLSEQMQLISLYGNQLQEYRILSDAMQKELVAGNIAKKDYLRVEAVIITMQQDISDLEMAVNNIESELHILLKADPKYFIAAAPTAEGSTVLVIPSNDDLVAKAYENNPLYRAEKEQLHYLQANLDYQKALSKPDITVSTEFDRNSNYTPNYWGAGISIPIPLLNRNKGNIKAASFNVQQQIISNEDAALQLSDKIAASRNNLSLLQRNYDSSVVGFYGQYKDMQNKMLQAYSGKQVSLLELLDFFDTYTNTVQQYYSRQLSYELSKEELNYEVGTDVF